MANLRPFRAPWTALVLVLVFPLMGQEGCDTCPQPPNLCQQYVWYAGSGECELRNRDDGEVCDEQGNPGVCTSGQCVTGEPSECEGDEFFGICDNPVGGGLVGACADDRCVLAAPQDECMRVAIGRINCCSPQGCASASGAYCTDPLHGVSCDPAGIEPPEQFGQDGICDNGTCVAQTGSCANLACRTTATDPCVRDYCNPDTGACADFPIVPVVACASEGNEAVCQGGTCVTVNGNPCDDGDTCTRDDWDWGAGGGCNNVYLGDGRSCTRDGYSGVCQFNRCQLVLQPCGGKPEDFCDDDNPCTFDECEPTQDLCRSTSKPDDTSCLGNLFESGDFQGLCRYGVCLPNLCIGRDCSDGDLCTQDVCIPPFGICSNPDEPDGTTCENNGQCFLGNCEPVIQPCSNDSQCDDGKSCTRNVCNGPLGCSFPRVANGQPCLDGEVGTCIFGNCSIGGP